jgi:hypothetical protein
MKTIFAIFTFGLLLIICPQVSKANWFDKIFGYDSYEDCLLGEIKGNETQAAARLKYTACRQKFPPPPEPPAEKVSKLFDVQARLLNTYKQSDGSLGTGISVTFVNTESYNIDGYLELKIYHVLPGKKCTVKNPTPEQTYRRHFRTIDNLNHFSFNVGHPNGTLLCIGKRAKLSGTKAKPRQNTLN